MKDFFKEYFRRFLIGAAAVVLTVAVLIAWLIVQDGDNPLFYLISCGITCVIVPLLGVMVKE